MINKPLVIFFMLFCISNSLVYGQEKTENTAPFELFNDYKRIGFYVSARNYFKGKVTRDFGSIEFNEGGSYKGYALGVDYLIRPQNKLSFRTGLHFNKFPLSKGEFVIPENYLPWLDGEVVLDIEDKLSSFSIPLEADYKLKLDNKIFLSLRGGINLLVSFQKSDYYDFDAFVESNDPEFDFIQITKYRTTQSQIIYPNIKLSPGLYFVFDTFILQSSIVYQKNILNFHKANYKFGNFDIPETTEGTYKFTGDYIGLDFVLFLKKTRTKK